MLYRSEAATLFLKNGRPSSANHRPSHGLHLVRHRDVGMQIRVPGAGIAVGERRRDEPVHLDLGDAALPRLVYVAFRSSQVDRVRDGVVVGCSMIARVARGEHPQGGDALDGGERQVEARDRGGGLPRDSGQVPGQLAGMDRITAVGFGEHLGCDVAADLGADLGRDGSVGVQSLLGVVVAECAGRAAVEHVGLLVNPVRIA